MFSKAALWLITLTAFITVMSMLPLQWEASSKAFSVRWGKAPAQPKQSFAMEVKKIQAQLAGDSAAERSSAKRV